MPISREIKEGNQRQGADEQVVYRLDTSNWSATPTSPSTPSSTSAAIFTVTDVAGVTTYTDVTATKMSGATSVSSQYITLPTVTGLVAGTEYRVEVKFTLEGSVFEAYATIQAER
jgi:hypothetical protein